MKGCLQSALNSTRVKENTLLFFSSTSCEWESISSCTTDFYPSDACARNIMNLFLKSLAVCKSLPSHLIVQICEAYWNLLMDFNLFPSFFFFFKALLVYSRFTVVRKRKPVHFSFFLSHHKEEKKTHLVIVLCKWTGQRGFLTSGWLSDTSSAWMHPITQIIIFQEFI